MLGIPSSNFGNQELSTNCEIKSFVHEKYAISFPLTQKYDVIGENIHPFFQYAVDQLGKLSKPKWNFYKYLIDKNGHLIDYYMPITSPTSKKVIKAITSCLK